MPSLCVTTAMVATHRTIFLTRLNSTGLHERFAMDVMETVLFFHARRQIHLRRQLRKGVEGGGICARLIQEISWSHLS